MKKIILFDTEIKMCDAWKTYFDNNPEVDIFNTSFENIEATYTVTAGNSYGIMTGGIDLAVRNYYGYRIQDLIQEKLFFIDKHKLNPGSMLIVKTNDASKPNLVYVSTMETPRKINSLVIYNSVFNILKNCYEKDGNIAICGLGTSTGGVPYDIAAEEYYDAYTKYKRRIKR